MKKTSKMLSIILAILMVMSVIPITASAATYSGACGDKATWSYDALTNTLTISGAGDMYDFSSYSKVPWSTWRNSFNTIIIEEGITSIGNNAFNYCQNTTSITIPDSVTRIGEYSFDDCIKLENIKIPDGVTVIGSRAFKSCKSIKRITIPDSVNFIGDWAFYGCYGLTEIIIPDSVMTIGENTFKYCKGLKTVSIGSGVKIIGKWAFAKCDSLTEIAIPANVIAIECTAFSDCESLGKITVDSNNLYYSNDDYGVLFNKDKTTLIQYPSGSASTNYVIPNSVTTLCTYAFCYASNLESVTIPDSITSLDDFVFDNKYDLILYYKGTQAQWDELLANNSETSEYLKNYTVICIDNTTYPSGICGDNLIWLFNAETNTLTISGTGAMYDYEIDDVSGFINQPWYNFSRDIKHIVVEDGVTSIGEAAFISCDATDITIGDSVISIGNEALDHCDELTNIIVDEDNPYYSNDEFGVLFNKDKTTLIYYPLGSQRESYTIPDGVTTIKRYAFDDCGKVLKSVTVPKSVTTIENLAISQYSAFTSFVINYLGTETEWNAIDGSDDISFWTGVTFAEQEHKHNYESAITAPTCTERGYTTYTCECGDSYVDDYVDATGHSHTSEVSTPATHTETGIMTYTCVCGDTYTEAIEKLEKHNYEIVVTVPTCTEQGYRTYTCECGDSYVDDYVDATGHNYSSEITIPATHTTTGIMTYTCACGDSYTEVIEKLEKHNYESVVTAPTCTAQGYTTYTCECGDSYVADYVDALGHTPANAVEENYVATTCTENGSKDVVIYCSVCDDEISRETVTLDATGHTDNDGDGYCDADNELLDPTVECDCNCHNNGLANFLWKIINFFNKLFGLNKLCECGVSHY